MLELELFRSIGIQQEESEEWTMRGFGLSSKNVRKARKIYRKSMRVIGLDALTTEVEPPNGDEKDLIRHCVASGFVENIFARNQSGQRGKYYYHHLGGLGLARELSNRSVLDSRTKLVVGVPRFYMANTKHGWKKIDIVESAQEITAEQITKLDLKSTTEIIDTVVRDGMLKVVRERRAKGIKLGSEVVNPEDGEIDPGVLLAAVLNNPGQVQKQLRNLKNELHKLQHLTLQTVDQISQEEFEGLLMNAIRQSGTTELHLIDARLREVMAQHGVSKNQLVSAEREQMIRQAATPNIVVEGVDLQLTYESGHPIAKQVPASLILGLANEVTIPDGRDVFFRVPKISERDGGKPRGYQDLPARRAKKAVSLFRKQIGVSA